MIVIILYTDLWNCVCEWATFAVCTIRCFWFHTHLLCLLCVLPLNFIFLPVFFITEKRWWVRIIYILHIEWLGILLLFFAWMSLSGERDHVFMRSCVCTPSTEITLRARHKESYHWIWFVFTLGRETREKKSSNETKWSLQFRLVVALCMRMRVEYEDRNNSTK